MNRHMFYAALVVSASTGIRKGEMLGLRWKDISFDNSSIRIEINCQYSNSEGLLFESPKTKGSIRTIPIDKWTLEILKELKKEVEDYATRYVGIFSNSRNLVFCNHTGGPFSMQTLRRYFTKLKIAAKLPKNFTWHCIRHTHATLLLQAGVNVKAVSERLGHSTTTMTMNIYAHALETMQEAAVQAVADLDLLGMDNDNDKKP